MRARPTLATAADFGGAAALPAHRILGVIGFDAPRPAGLDPACPFACVPLPRLRPGPAYEAWVGDGAVRWSTEGGVAAGSDGQSMFGVVETSLARGTQAMARAAYERIFEAAHRAGCPNLIRAYNYLPDILALEHGTERYRLFNIGRHEAFMGKARAIPAAPAACGLGTRGGDPVICVVACAQPGTPVENPRQVSAYRYPDVYGPRSPSFSRAMLAGPLLCVSGTASIVGHHSCHPGDPSAQTDEIVRNLEAVMRQCGQTLAVAAQTMIAKIYVRRTQDTSLVLDRLGGRLGRGQMLVLQAEICRPDLAVEIEAFCEITPPGAAAPIRP